MVEELCNLFVMLMVMFLKIEWKQSVRIRISVFLKDVWCMRVIFIIGMFGKVEDIFFVVYCIKEMDC